MLGVNAIVVGEVGQYVFQNRKKDQAIFPMVDFRTGRTTYIPIPGKEWMESFVSISLRVIDVETGQMVYSGSGQFNQGLTNPPQPIT